MPRNVTAEIFLFDTCTHRCGYCYLAETGRVLDRSQLERFRNEEFLQQFISFFVRRSKEQDIRWKFSLTGGEPMLMPNIERIFDAWAEVDSSFSIYTSLNVSHRSPAWDAIVRHAAHMDYVMCSLHSEDRKTEDRFFEGMERLRDAGVPVLMRVVGHPERLQHLDRWAEKCEELKLPFYPTAMLGEHYPTRYTDKERAILNKYQKTLGQWLLMEGGVDTRNVRCSAGAKVIYLYLESGEIYPCIHLQEPAIGNLYEDRLELGESDARKPCPAAGIACSCDIHYFHDIVSGAEDSAGLKKLLSGEVSIADEQTFHEVLRQNGLRTSGVRQPMEYTVNDDSELRVPLEVAKKGLKEFLQGR